jgi:transcriptional regulator of acetoin/glycerol metabolism
MTRSHSNVQCQGLTPFTNPCQGIRPYKEAKGQIVDQFTAAYIRSLLQATGGNVSEAARQSGLSRVALQKIMARMEIDALEFKATP